MKTKRNFFMVLVLFVALMVSMPGSSASAYSDPAYSHESSTGETNTDWMADLSDALPLSAITIPGTHDSGSYVTGGDDAITQSMDIATQLAAGIRAFDIRLGYNDGSDPKHKDTTCVPPDLWIYHSKICQNYKFSAVMLAMSTFLTAHPGEALLMRITQQGIISGYDFPARLTTELTPFASFMYNGGSTNPTLGEIRGKIIVLPRFDGDISSVPTTIIPWDDNHTQDYWDLPTIQYLADKWWAIKAQFQKSDASADDGFIYANFLSGATGATPSFFASGHSDPRTDAPRLLTGWTRGPLGGTCKNFSRCIPEYPSVSCIGQLCSVAYSGANMMARDYLDASVQRRAGIVFTDFPGADLIRAIIAVNHRPSSLVEPDVVIASSPNPSTFGQSVHYTASVTGAKGTVEGKVTFIDVDDPDALPGCRDIELVSEEAACDDATFAAGNHTIKAVYSGNVSAGYLSADSNQLVQSVDRADASCSVQHSWNYDGSPHSAIGFGSCTGVFGEDLSGLVIDNTSYTDIPGGPVGWTFTDTTGNYNNTSGTGWIEINKAYSTTVVTFEPGPYIFRGTAFTATAHVTGAGGLDEDVTPVTYGGDCTNVTGWLGCSATANYLGDSNHRPSSDTKYITITSACQSSITVTSDADDGTGSLRQAIADACTGATIDFDASLSAGTILLSSPLDLDGNLTIDGSGLGSPLTISGNHATQVFIIPSGVIVTLDSLKIVDGYNNAAGGGIFNMGTLTVTDSTVSGNTSGYSGAGIANGGTLTVTNSTITGNQAGVNGGGIYSENHNLTVANSTLEGNSTGMYGYGGGIYLRTGNLTLVNSTLSGNSAEANGGGGIYSSGTLNYANTIIAASTSGGDCVIGGGTIGTNIKNLVGDGTCSASLSGDPKLAALVNNGGQTLTMALLSGSPAIDAGDDATCAAAPVNNLDQRGLPRSVGAHCDIGAYEWTPLVGCSPSIVVASTDDSGPGTLRQAIQSVCSGGTITFDPSLSGKTITVSTELELNKELTINGAGLPNRVTINGGGNTRVFKQDPLNDVIQVVNIDGGKVDQNDYGGAINASGILTLKDCSISNSQAGNGGGIYSSGTLTMTNCTLQGNSATSQGGGIYDDGGTVAITGSLMKQNSAADGGAILNNSSNNLTITNSTLDSNSATDFGGGLELYGNGVVTVNGSTFVGNTANLSSFSGGGIDGGDGTINIINSTFTGNSANYGGGIYSYTTLNVTNSTFSGNIASTGYHNGGADLYNDGGLNIANTILVNSPPGVADCVNENFLGASILTNTNNLVMDGSCSGGGVNFKTGDALMAPLADNGGPTQTMALLAGSPAIDAVDPSTCPDTDQRGISRPQGLRCDIGAYETTTSNTTVTFESGPYTYRGTAFTATAHVTGAGGLSQNLPVTYKGDCKNVTVTNGCTASASFPGDANHTSSSNSASITITRASLTVTANNQAAQYSDASPALTFKYSGFASGEGPANLTRQPACATARTVTSPAGTYPITCSGGTAANYSFTYVAGNFTVTQEDAYMEYSGDTIAQINTNLTLRLTVWDSAAAGYPSTSPNPESKPKATIGDITKMWVQFNIYPEASCGTAGTTVAVLYAQVSDAPTLKDGIGTASATWKSTSEASYCVIGKLVGDKTGATDQYYAAADAQSAGILFYQNSGKFAAGGGWVKDPGGLPGSFSLVARYDSKGNPFGQMVYDYRGTYTVKGVKIPAVFVIRSIALTGLSISGTSYPLTANLQGKCTIWVMKAFGGAPLYSDFNATCKAVTVDTNKTPVPG
ncbi:MAG: choice-of-anchor Q domain-containing protein, partial [Anaerolineales bacterium]